MTELRIVIVGAGECGVRAAFALREHGHAGPIVLVGDEPHLPYERPPLSKPTPAGEPLHKPIVAETRYAEAGIAFIKGVAATSIDRHDRQVLLADGRRVSYDRLLLATGSRPRLLPGATSNGRIFTLRTLEDAEALRARLAAGGRLAVVGGGFIGLEVAALARRQGMQVTVIESGPRVLMRGVPEEIAGHIHELHAAEGVDILCGREILGIDERTGSVAIRLSANRQAEADLVLVGVGSTPNVALAEQAGLAIDNGIAVDAMLATSDAAIFAAGDCCSFPSALAGGRRIRLESWRAAQEQGELAARNMLGAGEPYTAVPWFWSDQYDHTIQIAGLPEMGVSVVHRELREGFILFHLGSTNRLVAASGFGRDMAVAKDIRLAERLIASGMPLEVTRLGDPQFKLKELLSA
ncbi:MAG: FAD-dependent oxidoreductase [Rhizobiaceae bacterium]|nr:FAD-dependent oxidoreductase [Rhizobiaceae bacterium]